jgi:hypothetical protein
MRCHCARAIKSSLYPVIWVRYPCVLLTSVLDWREEALISNFQGHFKGFDPAVKKLDNSSQYLPTYRRDLLNQFLAEARFLFSWQSVRKIN